MRTHFAVTEGSDSYCGRGKRTSTVLRYVDCLFCKNTEMYRSRLAREREAAEAAFNAQTPRTIVPQFGRVNDDGVMECYQCKGVLFRERPRSLYSYHYVCAECGTSMHPLTETGMCQ